MYLRGYIAINWANSARVAPSAFAAAIASLALTSSGGLAAKAEGATRAEFAQLIAMYPRKYMKSDQVLRERIREDAARLDKLWKVSVFQPE